MCILLSVLYVPNIWMHIVAELMRHLQLHWILYIHGFTDIITCRTTPRRNVQIIGLVLNVGIFILAVSISIRLRV